MGLARGGGGDLGAARGRIEIDTSQLAAARAAVQAFAAGTDKSLTGLQAGFTRTQTGIGGVANSLRGLAGAFGVSLGIAGVAQLAQMAIAATDTANAFARQEVAARSLAGSQARLNDFLAVYNRATGGAIDQATALGNVTRLMAVGFADSADELEGFVTAVRGIALATGQTQEYVTSQLQLAIANQSEMRLDQLGLGVSEVKKRVAELRAENAGLSKEQAFQNALLGLANEKFGALAKSAEGQATGLEKAAVEAKNYGLLLGQIFGPGINAAAGALSGWLQHQIAYARGFGQELEKIVAKLREIGVLGADLSGSISNRTSIGRVSPQAFSRAGGAEERAVQLNWSEGINRLNRETQAQIIDSEQSFGRKRAAAVTDYNKAAGREAEDFARQRANAERRLSLDILDVARNSARQRVKWEETLSRSIVEAQADSAERVTKARTDANKRLNELDEDYQRDREKALRDHNLSILDAASRLDARAVAEAQANFSAQEQEAKQAHDDQRKDLTEQLQERLNDEAENLAKSIQQQQDAHTRQLADQAENDRLRVEDMQASFEAQKAQEDIERGIRLQRQAADHQSQMAEMDRQHVDDLAQIARHAAEERTQLDAEAVKELARLENANAAIVTVQKAREDALLASWDRVWQHMQNSLVIGPNSPIQGPAMRLGTPSMVGASSGGVRSSGSIGGGGSVTIQSGAIVVNAAAGMSEQRLAAFIYSQLIDILEDLPQ